jgi:hypothetical protein
MSRILRAPGLRSMIEINACGLGAAGFGQPKADRLSAAGRRVLFWQTGGDES